VNNTGDLATNHVRGLMLAEVDRVEKQAKDYRIHRLPAGSNPRPEGRGWLLVDYNWDEDTGIAKLVYRRRWDLKQRYVVEVEQPAGRHQIGWKDRTPIDRPAVLARYFESTRDQAAKQAAGIYGR
jgi:hypothetical protein